MHNDCASCPVWKIWQIFLNLKFHKVSKKINEFNFPSFIQILMGEIPYLLLNGVIEFIDLFAHLAELGVQKYPTSFPYWCDGRSVFYEYILMMLLTSSAATSASCRLTHNSHDIKKYFIFLDEAIKCKHLHNHIFRNSMSW